MSEPRPEGSPDRAARPATAAAVELRPLRVEDAVAAQAVSHGAFVALDRAAGRPSPPPSDAMVARGRHRVVHLVETDPGGAWGAWDGDRLVGVSLASRRGRLWFLSLLTVDPGHQGAGVGARLLEAAGRTAGERRLVMSSDDPRALRRYARAGLTLHAGYEARGAVDRSGLAATPQVREGDWARDGGLVDEVAADRRGEPLGPDLVFHAAHHRLLVTDGPGGRGYAALGAAGLVTLAATTHRAGRELLTAALAETSGEIDVSFLCRDQSWSLDVLLDAGLALHVSSTTCTSGWDGPAQPYLPSGALG